MRDNEKNSDVKDIFSGFDVLVTVTNLKSDIFLVRPNCFQLLRLQPVPFLIRGMSKTQNSY